MIFVYLLLNKNKDSMLSDYRKMFCILSDISLFTAK